MAEDTKPAAAPAPQTAPQAAPNQPQNGNTVIQRNAAQAAAGLAERQSNQQPGNFKPAVGAAPTPKHPKHNSMITNPTPIPPDTDPSKPETLPEGLDAGTIAEMAAGRAALARNKSTAEALEDANRRRAAGGQQIATNPVDATTKTAEVRNKG